MKKHVILCLSALMMLIIGISISSCSSSDDEEDKMINFQFQLCALQGTSTRVFNYGENVVFDLSIRNNSNNDITYGIKDADIIFDQNLFCVYSKNGNTIGLPWTGMYCEYSGQQTFVIPANSVKRIRCAWNLCEEISPSHPLCKGEDNILLPSGDYYTKFNIKYNKNIGSYQKQMITQEFKVEFNVQ